MTWTNCPSFCGFDHGSQYSISSLPNTYHLWPRVSFHCTVVLYCIYYAYIRSIQSWILYLSRII